MVDDETVAVGLERIAGAIDRQTKAIRELSDIMRNMAEAVGRRR